MNRNPLELISGLALYIVLCVLIAWSFILRMAYVPASLIDWLGRSHNPQGALMWFSLFAGATLLALLRLGIEVSFFKAFSGSEKVRRYLAGLPFYALGLIWGTSMIGFWFVFPSCQPPATLFFNVIGGDHVLQPSDTLVVAPAEAVTVIAQSASKNSTLSCAWEYAGPVFETPGAQQGCQVSARFANQPGTGFLTVVVSEDFCSQTSIFSLKVSVVQP